MKIQIRLAICLLAFFLIHGERAHGSTNQYFFRIVSTQQTHIVRFNPSAGAIVWTNSNPAAQSRVERSTTLSDSWITISSNHLANSSNALTVVEIPNMIPEDIQFSTISFASRYKLETNAIIQSAEEWSALWQAQGDTAPTTNINFTNETIVLVSMGICYCTPYDIWVDDIFLDCGNLVIEFGVISPGEWCGNTICYPHQFVRIPRQDLPCLWRNSIHYFWGEDN